MIKHIFEILIVLALLTTPIILYRNMRKGKHEVALFLGYVIPFVYLFFKQYFTGYEIKANIDTGIFILLVWVISTIAFNLYDALCEMMSRNKD